MMVGNDCIPAICQIEPFENVMSKFLEKPTTLWTTWTNRGMTPGSDLVPCIVWVLPEEVTPYANIVTVCPRRLSRANNKLIVTHTTPL